MCSHYGNTYKKSSFNRGLQTLTMSVYIFITNVDMFYSRLSIMYIKEHCVQMVALENFTRKTKC